MTFTFKSAQLNFDQESLDLTPDKTSSSEALYVDFTSSDDQHQQRFQLFIHPKKEVILKHFELRFSVPLTADTSVFCNGFLPNHRSGTYLLSDKKSGRGWFAAREAYHQQAPVFSDQEAFYSYHYGFAGNAANGLFLGSLNETTAFTAIEYSNQHQEIIIRKDITDLQLGHSFPLLDLLVITGEKEAAFKRYLSAIEGPRLTGLPMTGWMASKNENGNSAATIRNFLAQRKEENIPADFVLIGSGYAKETGDWLFSNSSFPEGLPTLISEIKAAGLKVGMNLSPLLCSATSDIYRQHPEWILKDENNQPVTINTESESCYVLDAYDSGVQDYLQVFCYTVTTQWGVELLKFDHLSAAFAIARKTKTRAQAVNDFLKMLRSSCPDTLLWTTDLPIATGCLYANYTSITSDYLESWESRFPLLYATPNAATARIQLKNLLQRNSHNQFGTAGYLVTLADTKNQTEVQQFTILFINALFSNISVIVNSPDQLSAEMWAEWQAMDHWKSASVTSVRFSTEHVVIVNFKNKEGKKFQGLINLDAKKNEVNGILLEAGETLVLGDEWKR